VSLPEAATAIVGGLGTDATALAITPTPPSLAAADDGAGELVEPLTPLGSPPCAPVGSPLGEEGKVEAGPVLQQCQLFCLHVDAFRRCRSFHCYDEALHAVDLLSRVPLLKPLRGDEMWKLANCVAVSRLAWPRVTVRVTVRVAPGSAEVRTR
jgi:hypothetical protein